MHGVELDELLGRHRLAAGDAGDIGHRTVDFLDPVMAQPTAQRFGRRADAEFAVLVGRRSELGQSCSHLGSQLLAALEWRRRRNRSEVPTTRSAASEQRL